MIRMKTLLAMFAVTLVAAAAVPAQAASAAASQPLVQAGLLHFDTPGHQTAEVTAVQYHRHYRRHRRYYRHH